MRRFGAVAAVAALVLTGCGRGKAADDATVKQTGGGKAAKLTVNATDYRFSGVPATVSGGGLDLELRNQGKFTHEAFLLSVGSTPQEQVLRDFAKVIEGEGAPIPAYVNAGGGVGNLKAGRTGAGSLRVPAGRYLLVCTLTDADSKEGPQGPPNPSDKPHFERGMVAPITFTGDNRAAPAATPASVVAKDYSFTLSGLKAGDNTVSFRNTGPAQIHQAAVLEFPAGVDEGKAQQMFNQIAQAQGPPPPGTPAPKDVTQAEPLSPGAGVETFRATLRSGRTYGFVCFINDRSGGPPHAIKYHMAIFKRIT